MKNFKNILHIMLTVASILGFLGGWATLAHARKPGQIVASQSQAVDPLPPLDAIPDINISSNNTNSDGLTIVSPPANQNNSNTTVNNSNNTVTNSNNSAGTTHLSHKARPVFTTTGS